MDAFLVVEYKMQCLHCSELFIVHIICLFIGYLCTQWQLDLSTMSWIKTSLDILLGLKNKKRIGIRTPSMNETLRGEFSRICEKAPSEQDKSLLISSLHNAGYSWNVLSCPCQV